ncbi:hypothetical protein CQ006_10985 [Pseudomonas cedrina]|uniref:Uncharacterized protein n=1 Tax=Pseudomonas cedrina TaxID=651740 RepID=A0A2S9DT07_PSECE|nr:hypothetical protein CLM72_16040 [Pseudomonas sp. MYb193]PRC05720.1 hypothetical protein CQ006_10985 [Pseudomonas cedrina]
MISTHCIGSLSLNPLKDMSMEKHFGNSGLFKNPSYQGNDSHDGCSTADWELKNSALNTKEFLICPKNYSEFLL